MSYLALARKWRPKCFAEVIGQEHVVSALSNALDSQKVHHAFLFSGTRGVGKTTLARIFAKALNCERGISSNPCGECDSCQSIADGNFIDLIEVDAASRTKVDDTRDLLDNVQYTPALGKFKVYLIDEVHMLSTHSFNALLKTLEEPPEHVKFLFATTHPQKLPATILSRCIQFNLKLVDIQNIEKQLAWIVEQEKVAFDSAALNILARSANGSIRDALSLLDQAIAYSNSDITVDKVRAMLGTAHQQYLISLLEQLHRGAGDELLQTVSEMAQQATDFRSALDDLMLLIHNISLHQISPQSLQWKDADEQQLLQLSSLYDAEWLQLLFQFSINGKRDFDYAPDPRSAFEAILLRMLVFRPDEVTQQRTPSAVAAATPPSVARNQEKANKVSSAPPTPAAVTQSQNNIDTLEQLLDEQVWSQFVTNSGLPGSYKSLLMNMAVTKVEGNTLHVDLDSSSRAMFNEDRSKKIEQYMKDQLNTDLSLIVAIKEMQGDYQTLTPVRRLEKQEQNAKDAASKAFLQDEHVKSLVEMFDGEVVEDSIHPVGK